MLTCIIPAAGLSSRMNEWKPLLPYRGKPIIEHVIDAAAPLAGRIILVAGYRAGELAQHLGDRSGLSFQYNPHFERGMFSSIRIGAAGAGAGAGAETVKAKAGAGDFFILHADMPLITTSHISRLLDAFYSLEHVEILQPLCRGIPGHPVIFSWRVLKTITDCSDEDSMRTVFQHHQSSQFNTEDPAYITDIDTPEAYRSLISEP
jgi:molybdenum cofactor cytidylyltransferase